MQQNVFTNSNLYNICQSKAMHRLEEQRIVFYSNQIGYWIGNFNQLKMKLKNRKSFYQTYIF